VAAAVAFWTVEVARLTAAELAASIWKVIEWFIVLTVMF
jgi:hypothetical protein